MDIRYDGVRQRRISLALWFLAALLAPLPAWSQALPPDALLINPAQRRQSAQAFEAHVRRIPQTQPGRRNLQVQTAESASVMPPVADEALATLRIEAIDPRGTGSAHGLQPGELILDYDGRRLADPNAFVQAVQANATRNTPVAMRVLGLNGQERSVQMPPGRIGIAMQQALWRELPAIDTQPAVFVQSGQQMRRLVIDQSGRRAISYDERGSVRVWDLAQERLLAQWQAHSSNPVDLAISPSGRLAASVGTDRLCVWDTLGGRLLWEWPVGNRLFKVVLEADDRHFWVHQGDRLVRWDLHTRLAVAELPLGGEGAMPVQLALSPDERQILALSRHFNGRDWVQTLAIGDLVAGSVRHWREPSAQSLSHVAWSRSGTQIVAGTQQGRIALLQADRLEARWLPSDANDPVDALHVSPDGHQILRLGRAGVTLHELPSGRLLRTLDSGLAVTLEGEEQRIRRVADAAFHPANGRLLVAPGGFYAETYARPEVRDLGTATLEYWTPQGEALPSRFPRALASYASTIDDSGRRVARAVKDELQIWDIQTGRLSGAWKLPEPMAVGVLAFAAGGRQLLAGVIRVSPDMSSYDTAEAVLLRLDAATGQVLQRTRLGRGLPAGLTQSADGQRLAVSFAGSARIALLDAQGNLLTTLDPRGAIDRLLGAVGAGGYSLIQAMHFSPDGQQLLTVDRGSNPSVLWDVVSGRVLQEFPGGASRDGAFLPDGRVLVGGVNALLTQLPGKEDTRQFWWQATGGPLSFAEEDQPVEQLRVSPQGDRIAVVRLGRVEIWSVASRQRIQSLRTGPVQTAAFAAQGDLLMTTHDDGSIRLWSLRSNQEALRLLQTQTGDWIAMTPRGYFSASHPRAAEHVTVRVGAEIYALGQLFETFYRPDIVAATLAGHDGPALGRETLGEVLHRVPPQVTELVSVGSSEAPRVTVRYRVQANAGGLGDLRIYQNGKLVRWVRRPSAQAVVAPAAVPASAPGAAATRSLGTVTEEDWSRQLRTLDVRKTADRKPAGGASVGAGVGAQTRAGADAGQIEIDAVPGSNEITLLAFNADNTVASAPRRLVFHSPVAPQPPTLHILAIGIDRYVDPAARLKFAAKDASDVVAQFERDAATVYGADRVRVERLLNEQATRPQVLERLDALARRARPSDHVLIFAAAHGVMLGGNYQLVTVEYDGKVGPQNIISADEIVERSQRIPALSQWLVFDTCHAGGLGTLLNGLYDARVQVLARQSGMHVFAAASTTQEALDGHEGNGLFTHTLLQGVGPMLKADSDGDRGVKLTELGRYARERTRALAASRAHHQDPLIVHHGEDRLVARQR